MEESEREKIAELVKEVQKYTAFGAVSSRYTCAKHKCFLECEAVSIQLEIRELNTPYICDYRVLWRCSQCNQTIVEVEEGGEKRNAI